MIKDYSSIEGMLNRWKVIFYHVMQPNVDPGMMSLYRVSLIKILFPIYKTSHFYHVKQTNVMISLHRFLKHKLLSYLQNEPFFAFAEEEEENESEGDRVLDGSCPGVHQLGELQLVNGHHLRPQHDAGLEAQTNLAEDSSSRKICSSRAPGIIQACKTGEQPYSNIIWP